jgi:transcriptional regulator with XRE-family HTH domain
MDQRLKDFARNVKAQLAHRKWSEPDLAKAAHLAPKTVNNILKGRHAPQLDKLAAIADALKVPLWQLWIPELDPGIGHDETFPRLVEAAARLSPAQRRAWHGLLINKDTPGD